jgi:hypothetical protein
VWVSDRYQRDFSKVETSTDKSWELKQEFWSWKGRASRTAYGRLIHVKRNGGFVKLGRKDGMAWIMRDLAELTNGQRIFAFVIA